MRRPWTALRHWLVFTDHRPRSTPYTACTLGQLRHEDDWDTGWEPGRHRCPTCAAVHAEHWEAYFERLRREGQHP